MKLLAVCLILCFELQRFSFGQDSPDCNQIQKFVKEYNSFLNRVPRQTFPFFALCTDGLAVGHYNGAVDAFNEAVKNESCAGNFNRNKLNIVHTLYDQMTNIWETAHCSDCVSNSNDTETFFNLTGQLDECIRQSNSDPCELCISNYTQVQVYYEGLAQSRKGSICFDIEDRMNQTRYAWSAKYNCCKDKQHSQTAFIAFASGISSLPVLFYLMMYVITRKKEARERAAMPPLDDQASTVTTTSAEREEPQPSTSNEQLPQDSDVDNDDDDDEEGLAKAVDDEAKLNNLDNQNKNREGKLIDLVSHDGSSIGGDLNLGRPSKPIPIEDDDDDVSILNAMKANVSGRNLLD